MLPVGNAQLQTFGGYIDGDGGVWARIKVTYSTINNGWRLRWKSVGWWRGWGAMTTVRIADGDRADDDASASSPVPRSPARWWWQRWCGPSCTSTTATGQAMMTQHHHLSLACPRDGDGSGSGGRSCASRTATGQAMIPRHHHLSLARPHNGNGDGGGSSGADPHTRQRWQQGGR